MLTLRCRQGSLRWRLKEFRSGQRVGVLASTIRDLQNLSLQHFSVRNSVLATDEATRIGSDGYLMSLRRNVVVVVVQHDVWDKLC